MTAPPAAGAGSATGLALLLPLVALCTALVGACLVVAARIPPQAALAWAGQAVPLAACATLVSLAAGVAPALQGGGPLWVLPLWLAPALGGVGWAVLPHTAGSCVARAALLTLPLMMALLAGAWSRLPPGVLRAAAAAGAPPGARLWLLLRLRGPGAVLACVPVGVVCLALVGCGRR